MLDFMEKLKPLERKCDYISRVFYWPGYAKEQRLSHVKLKLYEEFAETSGKMREIAKKETEKLYMQVF